MSGSEIETSVLRSRSDELRARGAELRRTAEDLAGHADQVPWRGRAAETMRGRVGQRVQDLLQVAEAHEHAAEVLEAALTSLEEASGGRRRW